MLSTSIPQYMRSHTLHQRIKSFSVSLSPQPSCQLTGEMLTLLAGCPLSIGRLRTTSHLGISPQAHLHREALQTCGRPPPCLSSDPAGAALLASTVQGEHDENTRVQTCTHVLVRKNTCMGACKNEPRCCKFRKEKTTGLAWLLTEFVAGGISTERRWHSVYL